MTKGRYLRSRIEACSGDSCDLILLGAASFSINVGMKLVTMMTDVIWKVGAQPWFSTMYPLRTGAMMPLMGYAMFMMPKSVARLSGVVFSDTIAIRATIKNEKEALKNR